MWERFSFYGMRALLVLYLTSELLRPERASKIIGYGWFATQLEQVFGPLSTQAVSSQIYGLYGGLVFFTPLLGGLVADRWLGQRRAVFIGGLAIAAGHVMMAFDQTFLFALLAIIVGSGLFTPAIAAQVGALYPTDAGRQDRAYSLFYVGINIGAMIAPIVCGAAGELIGWHLGFSLAAAGMVSGLVIYALGARWLPPDARPAPKAAALPTRRVPVAAILGLMAASSLFWTSYSQLGNVLNLWVRDDSNLVVAPGLSWPVTWFQAFNPLFILVGTPLLVALWRRQALRGREPSTLVKMVLGSAFLAVAFTLLGAIGAASDGGRAHWAWTVLAISLMTLGELYLAPPSWSLFSQLAPRGRETLLMGLWLLPLFIGGYLSGLFGVLWERLPHGLFWALCALPPAIGALGLLLFRPAFRALPEG